MSSSRLAHLHCFIHKVNVVVVDKHCFSSFSRWGPAHLATKKTSQAHHTCRASELSCQHRRWLDQVLRSPASKDTVRLTHACVGGTWVCFLQASKRIFGEMKLNKN